jgi:hypothetical protein
METSWLYRSEERQRMNRRFPPLAWILIAVSISVDVGADTVYLKNGSWIDGIVKTRSEERILVEIGDLGKIEIPLGDVYKVEKNSRTGGTKRVSVEGRELDVDVGKPSGSAPDSGSESSASGAPVDAEVAQLRSKGSTAGGPEGTRSPAPTDGDVADSPGSAPVSPAASGSSADRSGSGDTGSSSHPPIDPELASRIAELIEELQRDKAKFRVRAERHLKAVGPPAIPALLEQRNHRSELVRVAVFRLFESFGDERVIEACIEGLTDGNEYVRDYAHRALQRLTQEDFGYRPFASPRQRESRAEKWSDWWAKEKAALEALQK